MVSSVRILRETDFISQTLISLLKRPKLKDGYIQFHVLQSFKWFSGHFQVWNFHYFMFTLIMRQFKIITLCIGASKWLRFTKIYEGPHTQKKIIKILRWCRAQTYGAPFRKKIITFSRKITFWRSIILLLSRWNTFLCNITFFLFTWNTFPCNINKFLSTPDYFLRNVKLFASTQNHFSCNTKFLF